MSDYFWKSQVYIKKQMLGLSIKWNNNIHQPMGEGIQDWTK